MYKINRVDNNITPVKVKTFTELGFSERKHLQEWIAKMPNVLGEELLIIQKEFSGFDETRERLDLLALDKDGNLVIIENKLDDSGRDVVWQALKYAGYCANLSKIQIVDIYQQYLSQNESELSIENKTASERIADFLDKDDLKEVLINRGNSQRVMLVAANYRKEVTNTMLWLGQFGLSCQCFKVTPYHSGDDLFLSIDQIIPTPESKDFMIGMAVKEAEEKSTESDVKERHKLRRVFWEKALSAFKQSQCNLYNNISPSDDHWLSAGSGVSGFTYTLIFSKREARVELDLSRSDAFANTYAFNQLVTKKEIIESKLGDSLDWLELSNKKSCRIQLSQPYDGYDSKNWDDMILWMIDHMTRLERAFRDPLQEINVQLKQGQWQQLEEAVNEFQATGFQIERDQPIA
jgi:hypothetical protein